jgi:hypothetical protein
MATSEIIAKDRERYARARARGQARAEDPSSVVDARYNSDADAIDLKFNKEITVQLNVEVSTDPPANCIQDSAPRSSPVDQVLRRFHWRVNPRSSPGCSPLSIPLPIKVGSFEPFHQRQMHPTIQQVHRSHDSRRARQHETETARHPERCRRP